MKASAIALLILMPVLTHGQTPTPAELAKALGFNDAEIGRIKTGEIVAKDLKEGSEKELAGVLAVLIKRPVAELASVALEGKMLETDPSIRAFRHWKPESSTDEAFAGLGLDEKESGEIELYKRAAAGSKLNLSNGEIAQFRKTGDINAEVRAMLKTRYEAYRRSGLKGIAPYARGGKKIASPA